MTFKSRAAKQTGSMQKRAAKVLKKTVTFIFIRFLPIKEFRGHAEAFGRSHISVQVSGFKI
jgi:hypothetical protein